VTDVTDVSAVFFHFSKFPVSLECFAHLQLLFRYQIRK
jgi:hypothetical protein